MIRSGIHNMSRRLIINLISNTPSNKRNLSVIPKFCILSLALYLSASEMFMFLSVRAYFTYGRRNHVAIAQSHQILINIMTIGLLIISKEISLSMVVSTVTAPNIIARLMNSSMGKNFSIHLLNG